jgi:hypothetical protein
MRLKTTGAALGAILLMLVWAAPTFAAPVNTPGVALVKAVITSDPDDGDPEGDIVYNGAAGPVSGNVLTALVTGNRISFTAPLTLIAPGPLAKDPTYCSYGLGHGMCTLPYVGSYGYPSGCSAEITGNAGPDRITLRLGYVPYPYLIPTDCYYMFIRVVTKGGNDVIHANDDGPSAVVCGAGYDQVVADSWDSVASDCEAVGRV